MSEKREHSRAPLRLQLTYTPDSGENFLYETSTNISHGGIFIETRKPLPMGTDLTIRFRSPEDDGDIEVVGVVRWVNAWRDDGDNPNPGMGISFSDLDEEIHDRIVAIVKSIAILPG